MNWKQAFTILKSMERFELARVEVQPPHPSRPLSLEKSRRHNQGDSSARTDKLMSALEKVLVQVWISGHPAAVHLNGLARILAVPTQRARVSALTGNIRSPLLLHSNARILIHQLSQ